MRYPLSEIHDQRCDPSGMRQKKVSGVFPPLTELSYLGLVPTMAYIRLYFSLGDCLRQIKVVMLETDTLAGRVWTPFPGWDRSQKTWTTFNLSNANLSGQTGHFLCWGWD